VVADFCAIALVRKVFQSLSQSLSLTRILITMSALTLFSWLIYFLPPDIAVRDEIRDFLWLPDNLSQLSLYNTPTAFFCFVPTALLAVLLIHRLMWPLLGRLLYPVAARRIITDKKVLIPVGTLALTFALGLEHVGAKELLKLFS
jgi:hypothetical protein